MTQTKRHPPELLRSLQAHGPNPSRPRFWCWPTAPCWKASASAPPARGRRGLLQHRDDRLRGNPHRPVLCRADHHLHLPAYRQCRHQRGRHRERQHGGAARAPAASSCIPPSPRRRTTAPPSTSTTGCKARGIIGLAGIDTRALTALIREKGMPNAVIAHDAVRQVRSRRAQEAGARLAGPRRHGPRADGDQRPALHLGRDAVGLGQGLRPPGAIRNSTSSPSTTASSATSCGCSPAPAARSRWCRRRPRPRTSWRSSRTACSCRTAPAIRRRPANTPCR